MEEDEEDMKNMKDRVEEKDVEDQEEEEEEEDTFKEQLAAFRFSVGNNALTHRYTSTRFSEDGHGAIF